jgi:hypothetical protein
MTLYYLEVTISKSYSAVVLSKLLIEAIYVPILLNLFSENTSFTSYAGVYLFQAFISLVHCFFVGGKIRDTVGLTEKERKTLYFRQNKV